LKELGAKADADPMRMEERAAEIFMINDRVDVI